jgi:TRAP-type uncharacterized transport system fused permease subunit
MVLIGTTPLGLLQNLITACAGMTGVGVAMIGFGFAKMSWWERILFAAGGLMLIDPGTLTDIIGLAILTLGFLWQWRRRKKGQAAQPAC